MIFVLGFLIAAMVGLTGVGAGSATTPILILWYAQPPAAAVGTALVFGVAIKVAVAPLYWRRGQVDRRALVWLCAGGIPGVLTGVVVLALLKARFDRTILLLVGLMVAGIAFNILVRLLRHTGETVGRERRGWLPWLAALIGAEVGFSSAGAGALGSLVLMNCTKLPAAQIVGTDVWFGLVISTIGGGWHLTAGDYDATLLWKLVAGGLVGVFCGAGLAGKIPPRWLRIVLSAVLCALGAELCWKAL